MPSKNGVEGLPLLAPASSSVAQTHQGSIFSSYVGILCAMLGAGIMTLPSTVAATTPLCGVWLLVVTGLLAFASLRCLCIVADATGEYSYEHFGKRFFHPVLQWILRLLTLVPCFGACVIYMIVAMDMVLSFVPWISRPVLSALFAVLTFPLCLLDTFHALQYSNTIVIACIFYITGVLVHHAWGLAWPDLSTLPGAVTWGALAYAIPIQTFSFCCHFNYMRVYGELEHKPSMTIVTWLVMGSAACIYATYSLAGYLVFAGLPPHDILTGFPISDASISGVRLALAVCMLCKTPLAYQPVRDLAEVVCLPKLAPLSKWGFRLPFTLVFFLAVYGVAITVNDLSVVMDWIGATDGILVSFVVPGMFLYAATTTKGCQERLPLYAAPLALSMTTVGVVLTVFSIYRLVIV